MTLRRGTLALACLAFVAGGALAQPGRSAADAKTAAESRPARVALVIGNAAYKEAPLANTLNDARDMAKALEAAGFRVVLRENASLKQMQLAIREFGDLLGRKSSGVFYFAGHGVQVRGRNYLVPVDADIAREDEVAFSALDLAAVLEKMDTARNPLNLVILDACRNNPFSTKFALSAPGLAQIDAPAGTLIAFSTAPGSVASDGAGRNGLYTQHLLEQMKRPGAAVEEVFKGVRAAVRKESAGKQVPWESTSLESAFTFVEAPPPAPVKVAAAPPAVAAGAGAKAAPRAVPASIGAPPVFAVGDLWHYRLKNRLTDADRTFTVRVAEIKGEEVVLGNGATMDLVGNAMRSLSGDKETQFKPSSQVYVFPLRTGAQWTLSYLQDVDSRRYENKVTLSVVGEEEVETPAGRFRALKVVRSTDWKERGKDNAGKHVMTYWYNSGVKRMVAMEATNTTAKGKVILSERLDLERYDVK